MPKSNSTSGYDQPLRSIAMSPSKPVTGATVVDKENVIQAPPEIVVVDDEDDNVEKALADKLKKVVVTKQKKAVK